MVRTGVLAAIILLLAGAAQAQCVSGTNVFNASRDLSRIGGNLPNMRPNQDGVDSAPLLRAALAYVVGNIGKGCTELTVDPGTYHFETAVDSGIQPKKMAYAVVPAASGLTVDLKGSDLVFKESYYTAFYIDQCTGCVFRNFTIDFKHLPFTQLEVTHVTWKEIIAEPQLPLAGQPAWLNPDQLLKQQPGPVQLLGFNTRGVFAQHEYAPWILEPIQPSHPHRIVLDTTSEPHRLIQPGDVFIVAARGGGPAIFEQNGNGNRFAHIAIYTSGGPGMESDGSRAMMFDTIRVVPHETEHRMVSTVAGGIALNNMSGPGTVVQNCTIIGAQDDSIAGNVTVPLVTAAATSVDQIQVTVPSGSTVPQNPVFFVNGITGKTIGGPPSGKQYTLTPGPGSGSGSSFTVKPALSETELSEFGTSVVYSWTRFAGERNVIVQGNIIENSYLARGIAFAGVSGLEITGNQVNGTQQAGILVDANLVTGLGETTSNGPVNNTVIVNNHLMSTNMGMSGVGPKMLGAIQIMGYSLSTDVLNKQPNQQAVVEGNVVSGTQRAGIWIGNVYGLSVANNNVAGYHGAGGDLGNGPHLNDGLLPYVRTGFSKPVLAWCVANPPGTVLDKNVFAMCHPEPRNK